MVSLVTLDDEEARAVAAVVGGMTYKPKFQDEREVMLDGLLIEWLRIEPHSRSIGRTIGELDIRQATGLSFWRWWRRTGRNSLIRVQTTHLPQGLRLSWLESGIRSGN